MGSDFCLTWVALDVEKQPDFGKARSLIDDLSKTPIEKWPEDYVDQFLAFGDPTPDAEAKVLWEDLEWLIAEWKNPASRTIAKSKIGNRDCLFAGGFTAGDDPSDAFTSINRLCVSGAARAAGFE